MREVASGLFVGDDRTYQSLKDENGFYFLHAAKEPYHRQMVGYSSHGAPRDNTEYYIVARGNRLALNLIDVDDVKYIPETVIQAGVSFGRSCRKNGSNILVNCNEGRSRAPTLAMLIMAPELGDNYDDARRQFDELYPAYSPKKGVETFARTHWRTFSIA